MSGSGIRYFYANPLKAAWMAQNFEMKFGIKHQGNLVWDWIDTLLMPRPATTAGDILEDYPNQSFGSLYIHPDSLHLLEPQDGDQGQDEDGEFFTYNIHYKTWNSVATTNRGDDYIDPKGVIKIIQRNGVAFMWPESEKIELKERCPTRGEHVNSIFDHVDRDEYCNEVESDGGEKLEVKSEVNNQKLEVKND